MSSKDVPDFLGRTSPKQRQSRGFVKTLTTAIVLFLWLAMGALSWFAHDQSTWTETDGAVIQRIVGRKGADLVVAFNIAEGRSTKETVQEGAIVHKSGESVRIRYALNSSGNVRNSRLAEEPVEPVGFFVATGVVFVLGLVVLHWVWFRFPPDSEK